MRLRATHQTTAAGLLAGLALYLGLSVAVRAQPPGGLPDLRAMSGRPLPVADLPVGTVTIRVARTLPMNAVPDLPVKATITGSDGKAANATVNTGADGRATFTDLPPGAEFQAGAEVDGEKLETSRFTVPPQGGVRVMLIAAIAAAPAGAAAHGEAAASDTGTQDARIAASALTGKVEDAADLPIGTLEMQVKGADGTPQAEIKIRLGQVATGGEVKAFEATTGADGRARLADLPIGPAFAYAAVAELGGLKIGSRPFRMPEGHGMRAYLEPAATTHELGVIEVVEPSYFVIEYREGGVVIQENFSLANGSDKIFDPGLGGLRFPLPKAALQAQAIPDGTPLELEPQVAMIMRGQVLPTGNRVPGARVRYAYLIPSNNDDELEVTRTYPIPIRNTLILVPGKDGTMEVRGPGITFKDSLTTDNGTTVRRYLLSELPMGNPLTLSVTGIPTVSRTGHHVAATLAIVLAVLGAIAAFAQPGKSQENQKRARTRADLGNRRENLFAELVEIERERRATVAGQAAGPDLAKLDGKRKDLVAKIEAVYRDLAALDRQKI